MKGLLLVMSIILLAGCAEFQTLEELEFAALQSGDWSQVQRRENNIARRTAQSAIQCPSGAMLVCEERARGERCSCMSRDEVARMLGGY